MKHCQKITNGYLHVIALAKTVITTRLQYVCFTFFIFITFRSFAFAAASTELDTFMTKKQSQKPLIVLIHGMARSQHAMQPLVPILEESGYNVLNINYPSTKYPLDTLVKDYVVPQITTHIKEKHYKGSISFVTHSLGGIILRYIDHQQLLPSHVTIGTSVMLAPPNHGSEVVDKLGSLTPFYWVNGPVGRQLATKHARHPKLTSVPTELNLFGQPSFMFGVIAGNKSADPAGLFLPDTPLGHDGKVTVESTMLDGMADHITLPYSHTFLMSKKPVQNQIIHFLAHGQFNH